MIAEPPPLAVLSVIVPDPESVTLFSRVSWALVPAPPSRFIWPPLMICVPNTSRVVLRSSVRLFPLASCRLATLAVRLGPISTWLVPSVIHALVELVGTPPLQLPATLQLPLPSVHVSG